jgi:hypothetical protein
VIVHHYSICTTHMPPSLSLNSSETLARLSHSSSRSVESDPGSNNSLLADFEEDDAHGYVSRSESLAEELRRHLRRLGEEGEADPDVPREDPWTTWFPPTPPLRSNEAPRSEPSPPALLSSSADVAPSVLTHSLGMRCSEMGTIEEGGIEFGGDNLQQELLREQAAVAAARPHERCEGLPDDEADFAQRIHAERSSPQVTSLCWACKAALHRYARRHNIFW